VVVDGGSTDGTLNIIENSVDDRAVISSEPDEGVCDAFNKGLARATGDIIGFLHSDDFFADNQILSMVAEAFIKHRCDVVYGDLDYVRHHFPDVVVRHWKSGSYTRRKLRLGWMPPHPTFFIHRRLLTEVGRFDCKYRISCDYDFILKSLAPRTVSVRYIDKVMIKMRVGGLSNGSIKQLAVKSAEDLRVIRENGVFLWFPWVTLVLKNVRKIPQFLFIDRAVRTANSERR
jgi:glycosyltransferase